ncbi:BZ3500_MvSof-1268-A1-R1_Chr6-3g08710 [Microbotryum saponariae]|uniref:tRNA (adenine(58)-N(1))-methyltransferase non-catalytic subunit TRM6 n=1 Tax=Microbotryum saponariae TaxID=289078 RepID=A0A2X0LJP7_9BASI|nr:BZ3500_MvSof-1268-A1-R1_Chr6-3g08710 [Microbotryum saponariae]SDA07311.1 BZ3501_MvSof-1269-A2-R1_Chr6-2g08413 [Microbotryum saponariae]
MHTVIASNSSPPTDPPSTSTLEATASPSTSAPGSATASASAFASTSTSAPRHAGNDDAPAPILPRHVIREGDNVLLRLPSTVVKTVKVTPSGTISLGKYGSFKASHLVGLPYGPTYEILDDGALKMVPRQVVAEIEETEANNQEITATGAQSLTYDDINAFRSEGLSGRQIIEKQIQQHANFDKKTEYSKDKYLKRKEAKYLRVFTPIEPTVHNICEYNFEKQSAKIRELRPDTLSNMMNMANVRPGARLLVVEDVHGMVVSACVERMGGQGRLIIINDFDSPPDIHITESFNFPPSSLEPIGSLHWGMTDPSWVPADLPLEVSQAVLEKTKNSRDIAKIKRRKAAFELMENTRKDFFAGAFDGVILATPYEPLGVLDRLLPYIAGSAPIVIYSPHQATLSEAYQSLRTSPHFLSPTLSEPWLRKYQVLPGRCHPEMNGLGHGGFLLTTTRVFDNPEANSHKVKVGKKRKLENGDGDGERKGEGVKKGKLEGDGEEEEAAAAADPPPEGMGEVV